MPRNCQILGRDLGSPMSAEANPNPVPSPATDPGRSEAAVVGATDQAGDGAGPNRAVEQANGDLPPPNAAWKQPLIRRVSCLVRFTRSVSVVTQLFRRQNRVHNTYEAQTAKSGRDGNVSEPTALPTTDEQPIEETPIEQQELQNYQNQMAEYKDNLKQAVKQRQENLKARMAGKRMMSLKTSSEDLPKAPRKPPSCYTHDTT
uniref:Pepsin-I3 domain-containing protein n=1 Tax=Angiostrongylus cantonensis TaxID=6313 RepID=A0A0K0DHP9_ANGCA